MTGLNNQIRQEKVNFRSDKTVNDNLVTPEIEKTTVDGVIQNYLDQLLISATEIDCEVSISAKVNPEVEVNTDIEVNIDTEVDVDTEAVIGVNVDTCDIDAREQANNRRQNKTLFDDEHQKLKTNSIEAVRYNTLLDSPPREILDIPTSIPFVKSTEVSETKSGIKETEERIKCDGVIFPELKWDSHQGVECLIFTVGGLKLAIPLPHLGGVFKIEKPITPLFGQAPWSMGLYEHNDKKFTVIDTADFIMPEKNSSLRQEGCKYVIQLAESRWGLGCTDIAETLTLCKDRVKWRSSGGKRLWLSGTVITEMCALIDVKNLINLINQTINISSETTNDSKYGEL